MVRAVEETSQRTSTDERDLPGRSFHHPSPFPMPVERPRDNMNECDDMKWSSARPGCVEAMSDLGDEADALGASGGDEAAMKRPKKLRNASEHEPKGAEQRSRDDPPEGARGKPEEPGGEPLIPGSVQSDQEGPEGVRSERIDGTDALSRDTGPGGRLELQGELKGVEIDRDRRKVVEDAMYDGK